MKAIAHLKSLIVAATKIAFLKPVIFVAALVPAAVLAYRTYTGENLPANPQEYLTRQTGWWALLFLMVALSVTPVRRLTGWNAAVRLRRMLGLFSFFYAVLHMLTWVVLLNWFDVAEMTKDVVKRPFITVGMATFLILFALALTSNRFAVRRLGKRWQTLHRLVYAAAIAGVVHFWMMVKADVTEPRRWAVLLALLLGFRLYWRWRGTPRTIRTT